MKVNQLLSYHPIYIYHKNISLLKYILTSREQYRAYAELYFDQSDIKIKEMLAEDEASSIKQWRQVAISTEQFQQFIINDGDEAMEIILREFTETRARYQNKVKKKPEYKQIIDSLELKEIQQKYRDIKEEILSITDSYEESDVVVTIHDKDEKEAASYSY